MIGVIGDLHFKEELSYADLFQDRRENEKNKVLDHIVNSLIDCDQIVFLGDQLNSKNNMSEVIKNFISFVERFGKKEIYIISGNHEKKGDGTTAIDFMREVNKPNWHIITKPCEEKIEGLSVSFLPYMNKFEMKTEDNSESTKKIVKGLGGGDILFHHHSVSGTKTESGMVTDFFNEPVLPKAVIEKKYKLIVGGHIHKYQKQGKTIVSGSIFTNEVNESNKYILKIDKDLKVENIALPGRQIYGLKDPQVSDLKKISGGSIVKVVITDKKIDKEELEKEMARFDAYVLLEQYPNERKKIYADSGVIDFSVENLLSLYAKERGIDVNLLMEAYEEIKQ